jgi:uncharacterized membrane protein
MSRYGTPEKRESVLSMGRILTYVAIIGAILFGCGIISFIAANWGGIPDFGRVILVLSLNFTLFGLGYYLRYLKKSHPRIGKALIFLSSIIVGASIFIVAQTYHVEAGAPWLVLLWLLAILPLAYLFRMNSVMGLSILVFFIWINLEFLELLGGYGNTILLIVTNLIYGIFLYSLGGLHELSKKTKSLAPAFRLAGASVILITTLVLTTLPLTQYLDRDLSESGLFLLSMFIFSVIAIAASTANLAFNKDREKLFKVGETAGAILLLLFGFFYLLAPIEESFLYYLLFNVVFLAEIVGFTILGVKTRKGSLVNVSAIMLAIFLLIRYYDFAGSLMDMACVLMGAGAVLLGGGYVLEKKRSELLKKMREGG